MQCHIDENGDLPKIHYGRDHTPEKLAHTDYEQGKTNHIPTRQIPTRQRNEITRTTTQGTGPIPKHDTGTLPRPPDVPNEYDNTEQETNAEHNPIDESVCHNWQSCYDRAKWSTTTA